MVNALTSLYVFLNSVSFAIAQNGGFFECNSLVNFVQPVTLEEVLEVISESSDDDDTVLTIQCGNDNLIGPIPEELFEFSSLHTILIPNSRISGSIPEEISQLSTLNVL